MVCPLWEKAFKNLESAGFCIYEQLIYDRHVTAGYEAFVVTRLFSSLAKGPQLRQGVQRLSSDDDVGQWICLRKKNQRFLGHTKKWRPQEARSMILGCVPLTTSVGLREPLLMWNAYILCLRNKLHVLADFAAEVVKDILNTSTYGAGIALFSRQTNGWRNTLEAMQKKGPKKWQIKNKLKICSNKTNTYHQTSADVWFFCLRLHKHAGSVFCVVNARVRTHARLWVCH